MLKKLLIENYALIDRLEIQFDSGLNILTGETGAGKSIIIGALGVLLGDKSGSDVVRETESKAVIEGHFHVHCSLYSDLVTNDYEKLDNELILRREIHSSGRTRSFLNDSPITLDILAALGERLVDLHGQHDHQALLKPAAHMETLDNYGIEPELKRKLKQAWQNYQDMKNKLKAFEETVHIQKERQDLLRFQIREIAEINPQPEEEEFLLKEEKIQKSGEKIIQAAARLSEVLYDSTGSAAEKIAESEQVLSALRDTDSVFIQWQSQCETARIQIEETVKSLTQFASGLDVDLEKLEEIRSRLGKFALLKKKYGPSMPNVIEYYERIKIDLSNIEQHDKKLEEMKNDVIQFRSALLETAALISEKRKKAALELQSAVTAVFRELGLAHGFLEVVVEPRLSASDETQWQGKPVSVTQKGFDRVSFLVSMNPGEAAKPLESVASGGEISRIMLAIKAVIAKTDHIPVLVFDEIDSGVSGRIARVVGKKLKSVGADHQILCITHLPQIASIGDTHFSVQKLVSEGRTSTTIKRLDQSGRLHEIAKLIGGEEITVTALESARELIL